MDLTGRVALLTGARRVGLAVATALADRGADVALGYHRSHAEAEAAADAVRARGRRAVAIAGDLSRAEACRALVDGTADALGRLDVLVCMASVYEAVPLDRLTGATLEHSLAVHVMSTFHCAQAAAPHMRRGGGGRIVTVGDWLPTSGRPRYPGYLPYYVAKAGVRALTEALALELAGDDILVNCIAPGPIIAPPELTQEESAEVEKVTPLGRWGGPEALAAGILAVLDLDFVTGETLRVDGGRHLR